MAVPFSVGAIHCMANKSGSVNVDEDMFQAVVMARQEESYLRAGGGARSWPNVRPYPVTCSA